MDIIFIATDQFPKCEISFSNRCFSAVLFTQLFYFVTHVTCLIYPLSDMY